MRILVTGAMGRYGGSVLCGLLEGRQHTLRAMTRRPDAPGADRWHESGVEICRGDFDDRASLRAALTGCAGMFACIPCRLDPARAIRYGRNLINAVAGSEVEYLVFTTLNGPAANPAAGDLESYARSLELPATFIRLRNDDDAGRLGTLVAAMFENPMEFVGTTYDVNGGSSLVVRHWSFVIGCSSLVVGRCR